MSVNEGKESKDPVQIRKARGAAKSRVTTYSTRYRTLLVKDTDGKFNHDDIDTSEVSEIYIKVKESFQDFQEIHERYMFYRPEEADSAKEKDMLTTEADYFTEVLDEFNKLDDEYIKYGKSCKLEKLKAVKVEKQESFEAAKTALSIVKTTAATVLASTDPGISITARNVGENVEKALESYINKARELRVAMNACGDESNDVKAATDYEAEAIEVDNTLIKLKAITSAKEVSEDKVASVGGSGSSSSILKLQKMSCPTFSGNARDWAHFERQFRAVVIVPGRSDVDIGYNLLNAVPKKHQHLINNLDMKEHKEMMKVLINKFGTCKLVIDQVVSEIEGIKLITSDAKFIEFVEKVEKIHRDMSAVKMIEEIAHAFYLSRLESKLPVNVSFAWSEVMSRKKLYCQSTRIKYDAFMEFLIDTKERIEYLTAENRQNVGVTAKSVTQTCYVTGLTLVTKKEEKDPKRPSERNYKPCLACNVDGATDLTATHHSMETCAVWASLSVKEKKERVQCIKHPFRDDHTTNTCTFKARKCKYCQEDRHHFLLCPKKPPLRSSSSNIAKTSSQTAAASVDLPVMVQAQFVTSEHNVKLGALMDLCSTDDYITHKVAKERGFHGEDVQLVVEGMGGKETFYETKLYTVPIYDKYGVRHELPCYGMETISSVAPPPETRSYKNLCKKFGIKPHEVKRPKSIDILISMRQNHLHPEKVKTVGEMFLYDGRMGKVFGGKDPKLRFTPHKTSIPSSVHQVHHSHLSRAHIHTQTMRTIVREATYITPAKSEKELLEYFQEESIGVESSPRCGGCRCGKCPTGTKQRRSWPVLGLQLALDS